MYHLRFCTILKKDKYYLYRMSIYLTNEGYNLLSLMSSLKSNILTKGYIDIFGLFS